jgi:hypothetical protein
MERYIKKEPIGFYVSQPKLGFIGGIKENLVNYALKNKSYVVFTKTGKQYARKIFVAIKTELVDTFDDGYVFRRKVNYYTFRIIQYERIRTDPLLIDSDMELLVVKFPIINSSAENFIGYYNNLKHFLTSLHEHQFVKDYYMLIFSQNVHPLKFDRLITPEYLVKNGKTYDFDFNELECVPDVERHEKSVTIRNDDCQICKFLTPVDK